MTTRIVCLALFTAAMAVAAEGEFGLVGISSIDTARLTAYCDDDATATPTACDVMFTFFDIKGGTLKQATLILQPGTSGFVDFNPPAGSSPVEIAPCWKVLRGTAMASLEVFDIFTERTRILINWGDRPVARTGDVDFGLAGITPFDTGRLSAYCEGDGSVAPPACDITFEFHDMAGKLIKQSRMILPANTGGHLDVKWADLGTTARRVEISPCWKGAVGGIASLGSAIASFAVIDNFTGMTLAQTSPAAPLSAVQ